MRYPSRRQVLATLLVASFMAPANAGSTLVTLDSRPGAKLNVMVLEPDSTPRAALVLYAGGVGTLALGKAFGKPYVGDESYAQNFLVRIRESLVDAGFAVLLPDVPSDKQQANYAYRLGKEQVQDARSVIKFAKERFGLPAWLVGTSASSMSVANAAIAEGGQIGGVIFSASVTRVPFDYAVYEDYPRGVLSTALPSIKVPALVLAHHDDGCSLSPPKDSEEIRAKLTGAPRAELRYFSGGSSPKSDPCNALAPHGFFGIEQQVVREIVKFIGGG